MFGGLRVIDLLVRLAVVGELAGVNTRRVRERGPISCQTRRGHMLGQLSEALVREAIRPAVFEPQKNKRHRNR